MKITALDRRIQVGWSLVFFFCQVSGKPWDSLPWRERMQVHNVILDEEMLCQRTAWLIRENSI
jgi:hypothetical protein